ncbi:MAG: T9SS type A sorting domain-containing protein [Bacteroidales bacterium]|jgi:hypothetical protein|nr:T9SS type A sorting domain-containing protein [Bacteroidales bacterium]
MKDLLDKSRQKTNRILKGIYLPLLAVLLMIFAIPKETKASYTTYTSRFVSASYDMPSGCLLIYFMYYDNEDNSPDAYVDSLFIQGGSYTLVGIYGDACSGDYCYVMRNRGDQVLYYYSGGWTSFTGNSTVLGNSYTTVNGDHTEYYGVVRWKVPATLYGSTITLTCTGKWSRGMASDDNFSFGKNVDIPALKTPQNLQLAYSNCDITLSWGYSVSGSADANASYIVKSGNTQLASGNYSSSGGSYPFTTTETYLNSAHVDTVVLYYSGTSYLTATAITIPAFPQATDFVATYNPSTKKVELTWNCQALFSGTAGVDYLTGGFQIQRSTNANFSSGVTTLSTVTYTASTSSYTYEDNTFVNTDANATYYYRIRRVLGNDPYSCYTKTDTASVSTNHLSIINPVATYDTTGTLKATITWNTVNGAWLSTSKFSIVRVNRTNGSSETILNTGDITKVDARTYVDSLISYCSEYYYRLLIEANNSVYRDNDVVRTNSIIPARVGKMLSFDADKGYQSDRVGLEWSFQGSFDYFSIARKVYGADDSTYVSLPLVTGVANLSSFSTFDANSNPGAIYLYKINGLVHCADTMFTANTLTAIGFRRPIGIASGHIHYGSGTAVPGVRVTAVPLDDEDDVNDYKSLHLNGQSTSYLKISAANTILPVRDSFSVQMYARPETKGGNLLNIKATTDIRLYYKNDSTLTFRVGNDSISAIDNIAASDWRHITVTYKKGDLMRLSINGMPVAQKTVANPTLTAFTASDTVIVGKSFNGNIDEVRFWSKTLDSATIVDNYTRFLQGNESGLRAYYRFEEAVDTMAYDVSRTGSSDYHKRHANIKGGNNAQLTAQIPSQNQLAPSGTTDGNGDYIIVAIPYAGIGTTYRFVPNLGVHSFSPVNKLRMISPTTLVQGDVDFEDVSSFKVWGKITYHNTTVPVSGVSFVVDGQNPCMRDGKLIETNANGEYEIDVPIGFHFVTAQKLGHTFTVLRGVGERLPNNRFPSDTTAKYDFQTEEEMNWEDNTLVELVGRFVGGPVQGKVPVGFGLSKNNVGIANIQLELAEKTGILNVSGTDNGTDMTVYDTSSYGRIHSVNIIRRNQTGNRVEITTDANTGEFIAWLLPEKYKVGNSNYEIRATNNVSNKITYSSIIDMKVNTEDIYLYDADTASYPINDTAKVCVDTIQTHQKMDLVLRLTPTVEVKDSINGDTLYGDPVVAITDELTQTKDTIELISGNNYVLGVPVFTHQGIYYFKVSVFEEYKNYDIGGGNSIDDRVPTVDGTVVAENNIATAVYPFDVALNNKGEATYIAHIDVPNITYNQLNVSQSYIKNFNFRIQFTDGTPDKMWKNNNMEAYVLGTKSDGNNFVTKGPKTVDFVLHDPPGSHSYAWIEKGASITTTSEYGGSAGLTVGLSTNFAMGVDLKTFAGMGAGVVTESGVVNNYQQGFETTQTAGRDNTSTKTVTATQRYETSAEPDFVGPDADIFIGAAYNIIFGEAKIIQIIDTANVSDPLPMLLTSKSGKKYQLGSQMGLFMVPEFETDFAFTRAHIVNNVIPNLKKLRDVYLNVHTSGAMPTINSGTSPYYVSILPLNDPHFGKNNWDTAFGMAGYYAKQSYNRNNNYIKHYSDSINSYYILYPQAWSADTIVTDSVDYFNTEINAWIEVLKADEKRQLEATQEKNKSFSSGVVWEDMAQHDTTNGHVVNYEGSLKFDGLQNIGATFNGTGVIFSIHEEPQSQWYSKTGSDSTNTSIYGYHLEDQDASDYHTVDIKKASGIYSTTFKLLGGQTSCPYEDEIKTQYFQPGENHLLQQATSKVQDPYMAINPSTQTNIPGNRPALFNLTVGNGSLVTAAWYVLTVDEKTNPDGLIIEIDGQPIANGRVFSFDPTESFTKTLSVKRTRQDITEYDSVRLLLTSDCQSDLYFEIYFSVHFLPACTDLVLERPVANQILNMVSGDSTMMEVYQYDVNYLNFDHIILQYRSNTVNAFTPFFYYYKDIASYNAATGISEDMKAVIDTDIPGQPGINRMWHAPSMDGKYILRAVSVCPQGPANEIISPSEEITIVKDMIAPVVFGTPQPADGIYDIGDDLLVTFNEDIQPDYSYRITISGELNGEELLHNYGLYFDGANDVMEVKQPTNLEGKSFTVEMWTKREGVAKNAVLFSHGDANNRFELGLNSSDRLWVRVNGDSVSAVSSMKDETGSGISQSWMHVAAVYDNANHQVSVYVNGSTAPSNGGIPSTTVSQYTTTGIMFVGSNIEQNAFYNGRINELRLWCANVSGQFNDIMHRKLSGTEARLSGYWSMDEARGTLVVDKIKGKNGITNAEWFVLPSGKSLAFTGSNNSYAKMEGLDEMSKDADFSVEFWFKADPSNANKGLFSTGYGDSRDTVSGVGKHHFSIFFDQNSKLSLRSAGISEIIGETFADNDWHHFALSVNRRGNANIYVDGSLQKSLYSLDYFDMFKGSKIWLGAIGWQKDYFSDTATGFFTGNIDELRIWKAALTREGINLSMASRLQGDEIGLRAYYPFDSVETATLITQTLCDQIDSTRIDNGDEVNRNQPITLYGNAGFSNTAANIKLYKRVRNVQFERVYNANQIYLNLLSDMSSIENCVLDIAVSDVRDMHGNIIASPVKWTAYIDRNYLKWGEEKLSFVKDVFAPLSFKVEVINRSGLEQMFTIDNLPAWLSASQSSGTIAPTGRTEITFTVDAGLNIGSYDENIYLRNSSGFNELLALDLRVIGEQPDWTVNPNDYDYSMNIFGELNIKGIVSADVEDILAAFDSTDACVGATKLRYVAEYDRYLAFLNVYGNATSMPLKFRIWDASTGIIYTDIIPDTLRFIENSYLGTARSPIVFKALNIIEQPIDVKAGWNWISTNVHSANMNPQGVFAGNSFAAQDHLKSQTDGYTEFTNGYFPTLSENLPISNAQMYMLRVATPKRLLIKGEPVKTDTSVIKIYSGWSWIGYTPQINLSLNEAFAGLNPHDGDLIKSQNAFSVYYEGSGGWLGTLEYLTPGNGYLYSSQDTAQRTFFYPNASALANNRKANDNEPCYLTALDAQLGIQRGKYQANQTLVARLEADEISEAGGLILGYANNECRGYGEAYYVPQGGDNLYFITISGDNDGQKQTFRYQTANGAVYSISEVVPFGSHQIVGSIENPFVFTLGEPQIVDNQLFSAYPVPFTNTLTLSYQISEQAEGEVEFTLTDVTGKVLAIITQNQIKSGIYSLSLNDYVSDLASGMYFVKMRTQVDIKTLKIFKSN